MKKFFCSVLTLFIFLSSPFMGKAAEIEWRIRREVSTQFIYENTQKYLHEMRYYLFEPQSMKKQEKYPLILNLGPSGFYADPRVENCIAEPLTRKGNMEKYPCYVVVPQCPDDETWTEENRIGVATFVSRQSTLNDELEMLVDLVIDLTQRYPIDPDRIYLYGFSNGATAGWALLGARPDLFSGAVLVSGATDLSLAPQMVDVPIWAFHSMDDRGTPSVASRDMVEAIRQAGGFPLLSEYPYGSHVVTGRVFNEPDLFRWLFSQRKKHLVAYQMPYEDVEPESLLGSAVKYLGKHGVLEENKRMLQPKEAVPLTEFVTMLLRTCGYECGPDGIESWNNPYLVKARSLGLLPVSEGYTNVEQKISRQQAARIARGLYDKEREQNYTFYKEALKDMQQVDALYADDVLTCYISGLMNDTKDGLFHPDDIMTRESALLLCYRMMERGARVLPVDLENDERKTSAEVIGHSGYDLIGDREPVRSGQTNLGTLTASAMMTGAKADMAIMQGGGLRDTIAKGDVTISNIYSVLPFDNTVALLEMKGDQILEAMNHGYSSFPEPNAAFCHVAGINFTVNANAPAGSRITIHSINQQEFQLNKIYKVATNNYLAEGGDGYEVMKKCNTVSNYGTIAEMLIEYIRTYGANTYLSGQPLIKVVN